MKKLIFLLLCLVATPAYAIEKNVASQYLELQAIDSATGAPKTGDAANLTAYVSGDGDTTPDALGDTGATEISSTNAPGVYRWDLTQAETNFTNILFSGKSSTSGVYLVPRMIWTVPSGFATLTIANNATASNLTRISGSAVSTSTAQLGVNVVNQGGTAGTFFNGLPVIHNGSSGRTYYIDDTDGTGDLGTKEAPYDTWAQMVGAITLAPGDIVHVNAGTYTPTSITVPAKYITIEGEGAGTTVFTVASGAAFTAAEGTTFRNFEINATQTSAGQAILSTANNITCENMDCYGAADGFYGQNLKGLRFVNSTFDSNYDGVNAFGSQLYSENCTYSTDGADGTGTQVSAFTAGGAAFYSVNDKFLVARTNAASVLTAGVNLSNLSISNGSAVLVNPTVVVSVTNASATGRVEGISMVDNTLSGVRAHVVGGFIKTSTTGSGAVLDIAAGLSSIGRITVVGTNYDNTKTAGTIRTMLSPTALDRTLDVTSTGGAGIDLSNVENPTTTLNLSGTTISTSQQVADVAAIKAKTDNLPASPAAVGDIPTVAQMWDYLTSSIGTTGSIGKLLKDNIDAPVSEAGGASSVPTDLATEGINSNLIFTLTPGSNGPRADTKTIIKGSPAATYAVDFKNVAAVNQKILTVDSIEIVSGTEGGITFNAEEDWARDGGTQARFRMTGVTAGTYVVRVQVTYNNGPSQRGDIVVKVVD